MDTPRTAEINKRQKRQVVLAGLLGLKTTYGLSLGSSLINSKGKRRRGSKVDNLLPFGRTGLLGKRDLTGKDEYPEETILEMNQGKVLDQDQDDFVEEPTFRRAEADPGFLGKLCTPFGCINNGK